MHHSALVLPLLLSGLAFSEITIEPNSTSIQVFRLNSRDGEFSTRIRELYRQNCSGLYEYTSQLGYSKVPCDLPNDSIAKSMGAMDAYLTLDTMQSGLYLKDNISDAEVDKEKQIANEFLRDARNARSPKSQASSSSLVLLYPLAFVVSILAIWGLLSFRFGN